MDAGNGRSKEKNFPSPQLRTSILVLGFIELLIISYLLLSFVNSYVAISQENSQAKPPILIIFILLLGVSGGIFSTLLRVYNKDSFSKFDIQVENNRSAYIIFLVFALVPSFIGGASSIFVYIFLESGLVKGVLFPEFQCQLEKCAAFGNFLTDFSPSNAQDYAKSLVWAFSAGFSERLMPSFIERLALNSINSQL